MREECLITLSTIPLSPFPSILPIGEGLRASLARKGEENGVWGCSPNPRSRLVPILETRCRDTHHLEELIKRPLRERMYELRQLGLGSMMPLIYIIVDKKGMMRAMGNQIISHFRD